MNSSLLSPGLSKSNTKRQTGGAHIVLSGSAGSALGTVLVGYCPLLSIDIDTQVDYSAVNALNNDLYISTFGYAPVTIRLSGLEVQYGMCRKGVTTDKNRDITTFFAEYNVHKNKKARVDLSVSSANGKRATYRCVVLSLNKSGDGHAKSAGVFGYELSLMGVKL